MNPNHTQSPEEMMRETEKTRDGIEKNLEALENRLSPDEMLDQIGQAVAPARDGAVEFARNLGDTVRENPIPAAMVGIGLGWLLLSGRRTATSTGYPADRVDPSRPVDDPATGEASGAVRRRARETKEWARERSAEVRDKAGESTDSAYRYASDTAHRAGARIGDGASDVGNFVQRRPILTGVAVAGVGAVVAAALLARTDRGRAVMARASDTVKDGSHRATEAVRGAAHDVSEAASEAAAKAGEGLDDAVEKTRSAAAAAGEAARSRAEAARDKVRGDGRDAKPGSPNADDPHATTAGHTRSVSEQLNPDANGPDVLKPAPVKPVPVSPPPQFEDVSSSDPVAAGAGEIDHHDTVEGGQAVPPIASKH